MQGTVQPYSRMNESTAVSGPNTVEVIAKTSNLRGKSLDSRGEKRPQLFEPGNASLRAEQREHFEESRARGAARHADAHGVNQGSSFQSTLSCRSTHRRFHMWLIERTRGA